METDKAIAKEFELDGTWVEEKKRGCLEGRREGEREREGGRRGG